MPRMIFRSTLAAVALAATATGALAHKLSGDEKRFLEEAARASLAEIELAQVAQQRGMRDEIRQFAARMVDDHTRAGRELEQLASARGVELPTAIDDDTRKEARRMRELVGPDFDEAYAKRMLEDHEEAVEKFEEQAREAEDPEVRAFAKRQLATLHSHLAAARGTWGVAQRRAKDAAPAKR